MSCVYSQCKSCYKSDSQHLSFFSLPTNNERAIQWVINCGRKDLIDLIGKQPHRGWKRVCSLHFERPCFNNDLRNSLTPFAIPTIFLSKEETDKARLLAKARSLAYASYIETKKAARNSETMLRKVEDLNSHTFPEPKVAKLQTCPNSRHICSPQETVELNSNKKTLHGTSIDETAVQTVVLDKNASCQALFYDLPMQNVPNTKWTANSDENNVPDSGFDLSEIDADTGTAVISSDEDNSEQMLCRLCARCHSCSDMVHIFGKSAASTECLCKIRRLLPLSEQPFESDLLPHWVCSVCCKNLYHCDEVLRGFLLANLKLRKLFTSTKNHDVGGGLHEKKSAGASKISTRTVDIEIIKNEPFPDEEIEENLICSQLISNTNEQAVELSPVKHEMQVSDTHVPSDSEDSSVSKSFPLDGIKRPIKRKSQHLGNQLVSGSSSQLIKMDSKDQVTSSSSSKVVAPNENRNSGLSIVCKTKRRRRGSVLEYQGKKIQNSHVTIPIASDNNTIECQWCDMNFDSVEAVLTHRFREHAEKEILSAKPK